MRPADRLTCRSTGIHDRVVGAVGAAAVRDGGCQGRQLTCSPEKTAGDRSVVAFVVDELSREEHNGDRTSLWPWWHMGVTWLPTWLPTLHQAAANSSRQSQRL